MAQRPLRLAMLGMWHVHAHGLVARAAERPDLFQFVGFHDPDSKVAADRAQRWRTVVPNLRLFDSLDELLRQPLEAVIVEGRIDGNLPLARKALEAGLPVLLEKPAGTDLAEFERLLTLADAKGLHLQMLYLFRAMSAVRELLPIVQSGSIGSVYEFRGRLPKDPSLYDEYVADLGRYPGGMFFEMAGHLVDMMVTLLGRPQKVTPFLAHHHDHPSSFIDNPLVVFEFPKAWGVIETPALEVAPGARRVEVYGTQGACVIPHLGSGHLANAPTQTLEVFRQGMVDWERRQLPAAVLQRADLQEFADCVLGRKKPDYSKEHDFIVQETLLRACGVI